MWMHIDDSEYSEAKVGVAMSSPIGVLAHIAGASSHSDISQEIWVSFSIPMALPVC